MDTSLSVLIKFPITFIVPQITFDCGFSLQIKIMHLCTISTLRYYVIYKKYILPYEIHEIIL